MTQTFQVPDTIPLTKVQEFLSGLSLPLGDLIELNVGTSGVYVELWALNADGNRYINPGEKEAARHRIAIRLDASA
jgi:hypothetical protein